MSPKTALLGTIAALPLAAHAAMNGYSFGNVFRLGSPSSISTYEIVTASTTFVPGAAPASQPSGSSMNVWPGLSMVTNEFVYGCLEQASPAACASQGSGWCLTSQYVGKQGLISGDYVSLSGSQPVSLSFTLNNGNWTTTSLVNSAPISTISVATGRASAFGLANVCLYGCTAAPASQTYRNTTVVLATAAPNFGATVEASLGATYSGLTTTDGGLTWTVDEIVVPAGVGTD